MAKSNLINGSKAKKFVPNDVIMGSLKGKKK
jgi:hypothetical protein